MKKKIKKTQRAHDLQDVENLLFLIDLLYKLGASPRPGHPRRGGLFITDQNGNLKELVMNSTGELVVSQG